MSVHDNAPRSGDLDLRIDPYTAIGPVFVGLVINWMLMGTLIVQVYMYYLNFVGDRLGIQLLVYGVFMLDVLQTVFTTHFAWNFMISGWNDPNVILAPAPWSMATIPIMAGLIAGIVQVFYAWRIWTLKRTPFMRVLAVLIVLIALCQSLTAIISSALFEKTRTREKLFALRAEFSVWLAGSFVADILISACMLWILYDARSRTSWRSSETLFSKLITNTIQTGSVTALCAGVDLALFIRLTQTNHHLTPAYILGKLYTNSLLVTLNARKSSRLEKNASQSDNIGMRVQVSRETHSLTDKVEREADQWPGVKGSRATPSDRSGPYISAVADIESEPKGKNLQVVDFTEAPVRDRFCR